MDKYRLGVCCSNPQLFPSLFLAVNFNECENSTAHAHHTPQPPFLLSLQPPIVSVGRIPASPQLSFLVCSECSKSISTMEICCCTNTKQSVQPRKQKTTNRSCYDAHTYTHRHLGLLCFPQRERVREALSFHTTSRFFAASIICLFSLLLHKVNDQMSNLLFMAHQNA